MSMLINFLDLFDHNSYFTMRRECWKENVYLQGESMRQVKEEDVESTLFIDPVQCHYLKIHGHNPDITRSRRIEIVGEDGVSRPWKATHEDEFADDWILCDHTEFIQNAQSK